MKGEGRSRKVRRMREMMNARKVGKVRSVRQVYVRKAMEGRSK